MEFSTPLDFEHDVVAVMDRSGYIRFITQAKQGAQRGRSPEEVVGHHLREFVHPDDVHNFDKWLDLEFSLRSVGAASSHVMFRVRRPNGQWRWIEATRPYLDGHHVRDHIIFFLRDIAAHRLIEHQYRLAEQIAGYGVWTIERGSPYPQLSAGMIRLLGYDPGDPETEKKFWPLLLVERADMRRVLRLLRGALEVPQDFSFSCSVRAKGGAVRILKTKGHVKPNASGVDAIFGVSQDVTEIRMAEVRLRASEEQYRLLTQRASDIICQLTPEGIIEFISPSVRRLTGRRPGRLVGLSFTALLPEEEHERFGRFLARLTGGDEGVLCTTRFKGKEREDAWLEISGRTLRDNDGKVYGLVCAARDISERKAFEAALERSRQQAEEISESKSRFLTNISHELRTPLNAILGFSELIRDIQSGAGVGERTAEYAALIHESGTLLRSLIDDLLDLSKIEAGKYELEPERIALASLAPTCIQQVGPQAGKKGITIEDRVSDRNLHVFADRRALTQILINLLSNAVKFTGEGGQIELFATTNDGRMKLNVRDTGIGIREEDIERITAPFEQTAEGRRMSRQGTGLGLALVKSLVELHGGALTIISEPGRGTTVSVDLPAGSQDRKAVA